MNVKERDDRDDRVYGAAVVAILFRRPDGRAFYVKRKRRQKLTFPTGHMKRTDRVLQKTLFRESQEEVFRANGDTTIVVNEKPILDVFIRVKDEDHAEDKIITLYLWDVDEKTAESMIYEEKGETGFIWLNPDLALKFPRDNAGIPENIDFPLDGLAEEGSRVFLEKFPVLSKEEGTMRKLGMGFLKKLFKLIFKKTSL